MTISQWLLANGESIQIGLFFGLLAALAILETLVPRRTSPMNRATRWPTNLFFTFLNVLALGVLPVSVVSAAFWAEQRHWGVLNVLLVPGAVAIAATLVVRAFISFFTHYLMHMVPLFWRLHRVHHLDTELDVTTTVRFHPLEFLVQTVPAVPIVVVFGLTPWVLVFYEILDVAVTLWTHSNTRLPAAVDRVLRYVIVTPDVHRIHHSAWKPETNSNYGAVFPWWDLAFGTYCREPRDGHEHMPLGLDEVRGSAAQRPLWLLASIRFDLLVPSKPRVDRSDIFDPHVTPEVAQHEDDLIGRGDGRCGGDHRGDDHLAEVQHREGLAVDSAG
jgi:sterol desaturase/sphingolipid hydroxylase (fatty acid hydroxylase superfamily)